MFNFSKPSIRAVTGPSPLGRSAKARFTRASVLIAAMSAIVLGSGGAAVGAGTAATSSTFTAEADSLVQQARPDKNSGGASGLRIDGPSDPIIQSYLRFTTRNLAGTVQQATLRIYATSSTSRGPVVYLADSVWEERKITWNNRPALTSAAAASIGTVTTGHWFDLDVTSLVRGNGTFTFALHAPSTDGVNMSARESSYKPQLIVTTADSGSDTQAPTQPTGLTQTAKSATSVSLSWSPSSDNVSTTGYNVYVDGTRSGTTPTTSYSATGLTCGRSYALDVEAFDAAGNLSPRSSLNVATSACSTVDTQAPSAPTGLVTSGATATGVTATWKPSTDNVGVAGYRVSVDGTRVATTTLLSYTLTGLSCGRTYTVAIEAYDAAGNAASTSIPASTAACPIVGVTCDKVAAPNGSDFASGSFISPFQTAQKLAGSLAPGQTGCLRAGTYSSSDTYVLDLSKPGYRIRSYPGERATLYGIVNVRDTASGVTLSHLDFEGSGTSNTVKIYAADVVVEDSNFTNEWRGRSCMILGSNSGAGQATRIVVRRNFFHECGLPANGNKDHAIYAQNVLDGEIVRNTFWNSAAYAIQLYPNAQRTRFAHNVVDGDSPSIRGGVVFGGDTAHASSNNVVENNVLAYAATYNITSTWSGSVGSGNVARNNCVWAGAQGNIYTGGGGFTASSNLTTDPLFLARSARNYGLALTSPCLSLLG